MRVGGGTIIGLVTIGLFITLGLASRQLGQSNLAGFGNGNGPRWPLISETESLFGELQSLATKTHESSSSAASAVVQPKKMSHSHEKSKNASHDSHAAEGHQPDSNGFVHMGKSLGVLEKEAMLRDHDGKTPIHYVPQSGDKHKESTSHHSDEHEHVHSFMSLLFLFFALTMGAITLHLLTKYAPSIPYTAVLLVEGMLLGLLHEMSDHSLGKLSVSINMWINIHPHLLLFCFLPALLFGDCMNTNWHTFKRCLGQILTLACPGVLMGSIATACFAKMVMPYHWDWNVCLAFGAILAATDPVAVVSLLNSVGASKKLTMVIAGESLFNDGTAIVVFTLFFNMAQGTIYTSWELVQFVLRMAFLAPIIGIAFGMGLVYWNHKASKGADHNYSMIQISVTICTAYLCFFTAEDIIHSSGVLAVVSCGITFAAVAWPEVTSAESMEHVWHTIEHVGNTLLFILTGLLMSHIMFGPIHREHLEVTDFMWLGILYLVVIGLRFLMIAILYPIISRMGYTLDWKDCVVMSWGGLRGAVGLAMAVSMDASTSIDPITGSKVLFFVGGVAVLTLLINGMTSGFILRTLQMTAPPVAKKLMSTGVHKDVHNRAVAKLRAHLGEERFKVANENMIKSCLHILKEEFRGELEEARDQLKTQPDSAKLEYMREVFYNTLRATYWDMINKGVLTKHNNLTTMLLSSIDIAMDGLTENLHSWTVVESNISKMAQKTETFSNFMDMVDRTLPEAVDVDNKIMQAGLLKDSQFTYMTLTCFIDAHKETMKKIATIFQNTLKNAQGKTDAPDTKLIDKIVEEAAAQIALAKQKETSMDVSSQAQSSVRTIQLANIIMEDARQYIEQQVEEGLFDGQAAHHLLHEMDEDARKVWKSASRD